MDARAWLEQVRSECLRQKLPTLYVERLVSELSDHHFDFMEDSMSTDAKEFGYATSRLGMPGKIASVAAEQYRLQRFSSRHPIVMFVLLPVITLPLLWAVSIICLLLLAKGFGFESGALTASESVSKWANSTIPFVVMGILLAPIAAAAAFYCRLAIKSAVSWKWILATCAILALIGGTAVANVALPTAVSKGTVAFGFGVSQNPSPQQLLQFAVPLSIGCWVIFKRRNYGGRIVGGPAHN
ncbi:MAG: hypothetical protein WD851_07700 [Pirellulales bacterium]